MNIFVLAMSQLNKNKVRTQLTSLTIVATFLLYGLMSILMSSISTDVDETSDKRLITMHKLSSISSLPMPYRYRMLGVAGVEAVTHFTWFGGYYKKETNLVTVFPIESQSFFQVYDDYIIDEQLKNNWLNNRNGAMVGDKIAQKNGWKVGQRINLGSQIYPQQSGDMVWSVVIEAIYKSPVRTKEAERVLIHYDYFNETRMFGQYTVSWFSTKLTAGANIESVAKSIDKLFIHSPNATKTQTETEVIKAFISQIGNVGKMITFVLFIAVLSMLIVIFSNLSQSFSDRLSDLAVMSVLGFSRSWIIKLVVLESLCLIVTSALLGLFLAFLVVHLGLDTIYQYLPNITIEYSGLYQALISAFAVGIIVSSIPIIKLISSDLISSLNKS